MKRTLIILCAIALQAGLFSCTPQSMGEYTDPVACCGEDGDIIPPPPPPPPPGGVGG